MQKRTLNQIAQLEAQLFHDDNWTVESIENLIQRDINRLIIIQNNQQLLGYCLYQIVFETAEILRIGVVPDLQNSGIGTQLFQQLLAVLNENKVETLMLEVREDNSQAIKFYQKHGFSTIHQRKNYYLLKNGESINALIMQKCLTA